MKSKIAQNNALEALKQEFGSLQQVGMIKGGEGNGGGGDSRGGTPPKIGMTDELNRILKKP